MFKVNTKIKRSLPFWKKYNSDNNLKTSYGLEAQYYQLSDAVGLKVYTRPGGSALMTTKDMKMILSSSGWKEVLRQAKLMDKYYDHQAAPRVLEVCIMQDEFGFLYPALLVEHISYKLNLNYPEDVNGKHQFLEKIMEKFTFLDSHDANVVLCQRDKQFKILDFGMSEEKVG